MRTSSNRSTDAAGPRSPPPRREERQAGLATCTQAAPTEKREPYGPTGPTPWPARRRPADKLVSWPHQIEAFEQQRRNDGAHAAPSPDPVVDHHNGRRRLSI